MSLQTFWPILLRALATIKLKKKLHMQTRILPSHRKSGMRAQSFYDAVAYYMFNRFRRDQRFRDSLLLLLLRGFRRIVLLWKNRSTTDQVSERFD